MRKISSVLFVMAIAGVAHAGDPATPATPASKKAAPPAADAKKAPPAPVKKAPPAPVKKAPPPVAVKPAEPPKPEPVQVPDPPKALLDAAKTMKGFWRCKGEEQAADGTTVKTKATVKFKLELDKFAIRSDTAVAKRKGMKRGYKDTSYRVYSTADQKWYSFNVDNMGGWSRAWSTGADATGAWAWEGEAMFNGQTVRVRDRMEPVAGKKNAFHSWGEFSSDGKTWTKAYDVTCTK